MIRVSLRHLLPLQTTAAATEASSMVPNQRYIGSRTLGLLILLLIAVAPSLFGDSTGWGAKADHHRGENGKRFRYTCGAGGPLGRVWGMDVYTDDSSVCTAAVHAGLIVRNTGGSVVIEIRPGRESYTGYVRNGVRSEPFGEFDGSFVFTGERSAGASQPSTTTNWSTTAASHRGQNGQRFTYNCPGNGEAQGVWGSGVYTDDSSVCSAALHHGLIGLNGGSIAIEIRPGQSSYRGSRSHGVQSRDFGAWSGSFMFLQ
jgi:hypothetical protein